MHHTTDELMTTDVLVVGCGVAGSTTALMLADAGINVTVVTRAKAPKDTNTYWAQGGIIYEGIDDSSALLAKDIELAGAGHCYPKAVKLLAEEGAGSVRRVLLERAGIDFDRQADGSLSLAREGGHTVSRIIHATDATGKAIEIGLLNALRSHPLVTLLTAHTAVDLLTPSHHSTDRLSVYEPRTCIGAYLFDQEKARVVRCIARKTVLATGGLGQIFLRTTNPVGSRGDGLSMAYRSGVRTINAEFFSFILRHFITDKLHAFSCPKLSGVRAPGWLTPRVLLLCRSMRLNGKIWLLGTLWRVVFIRRCCTMM